MKINTLSLIGLLSFSAHTAGARTPLADQLLSKKSRDDGMKAAHLELSTLDPVAQKAVASDLDEGLQDKDETIISLASYALVGLGDAGLSVMKKNLKSEKKDIRRHIVAAIGRYPPWGPIPPNPRYKPLLLQALKDEHSTIRMNAVYALGKMGASSVPSLAKALLDKDQYVRLRAAEALVKLGADAGPAEAALTKALEDEDASVRDAAASALKNIGKK